MFFNLKNLFSSCLVSSTTLYLSILPLLAVFEQKENLIDISDLSFLSVFCHHTIIHHQSQLYHHHLSYADVLIPKLLLSSQNISLRFRFIQYYNESYRWTVFTPEINNWNYCGTLWMIYERKFWKECRLSWIISEPCWKFLFNLTWWYIVVLLRNHGNGYFNKWIILNRRSYQTHTLSIQHRQHLQRL